MSEINIIFDAELVCFLRANTQEVSRVAFKADSNQHSLTMYLKDTVGFRHESLD